jgi:hypothetical protein
VGIRGDLHHRALGSERGNREAEGEFFNLESKKAGRTMLKKGHGRVVCGLSSAVFSVV